MTYNPKNMASLLQNCADPGDPGDDGDESSDDNDEVDDAAEESFPASDPPAW